MRSKPHQLKTIGIRFAIDENQIGLNMAIPKVFPIPSKRMIGVTVRQNRIGREQRYRSHQFAIKLPGVLSGLA
jgi:hypothetical protein